MTDHLTTLTRIVTDLYRLRDEASVAAVHCRTDRASEIPDMLQTAAAEIEAAAAEAGWALRDENDYLRQLELELA